MLRLLPVTIEKIKEHWGIVLILLLGLGIRLYMASLDPFLHEWDEKYHALVARNMMQDPFRPMMYANPLFPFDPNAWCCNHIWLHKQPLFMWQMALSMKVFGVSEWAMRLPSVLMGTLMLYFVYRIALLLFHKKAIGLIAAFLFCFSNYQLNLISGREGMDHNDVAFGFYVLASFWALTEYRRSFSWKWAALIGFFAGAAILNKWLTGLLVFLPWALLLLGDMKRAKNKKLIYHYLLALLFCGVVFLPWQIYILYRFPDLARYEYTLNTKHLFDVVEGHKGDIWFYFEKFDIYFGGYLKYAVILAAIVTLFLKKVSAEAKWILLLPSFFVFAFFSFIVQTKITGFLFVVAPLLMVLFAFMLYVIVRRLTRMQGFLLVGILLVLAYISLKPQQIINYTNEVSYRQSKLYNTNLYKALDTLLPKNIHVVINVNSMEHADVMFYNNSLTAYHYYPDEEEFAYMTRNNIPIAAFEDHPGYLLPDYIKRYKYLYIIRKQLKS